MRAQRILVPVDFSDPSRNSVRVADSLACQQQAELTLLYVYAHTEVAFMDFTYIEPPEKIALVIDAATTYLRELTHGLETPAEGVKVRVETGSPTAKILELSTDFDLIVMSTHSRKGLQHFIVGSVTERVVRGAACSVLVVKPR